MLRVEPSTVACLKIRSTYAAGCAIIRNNCNIRAAVRNGNKGPAPLAKPGASNEQRERDAAGATRFATWPSGAYFSGPNATPASRSYSFTTALPSSLPKPDALPIP